MLKISLYFFLHIHAKDYQNFFIFFFDISTQKIKKFEHLFHEA